MQATIAIHAGLVCSDLLPKRILCDVPGMHVLAVVVYNTFCILSLLFINYQNLL